MCICPEKIKTLQSWVTPTTGKQIEILLGFVGFLRVFVPLMSAVSVPLESLRKVKHITESMWTKECTESFQAFKGILRSPVVLRPFKYGLPLILACDASQLGIGAVLYQDDLEIPGGRRYIKLASRALNKGQRNYSATRRELLAIIFALQRFRGLLAYDKFELRTDHRALIYMFNKEHLNYMLENWLDVIMQFDFSITHCPGILNVLPDALSRQYPSFVKEAAQAQREAMNKEGVRGEVVLEPKPTPPLKASKKRKKPQLEINNVDTVLTNAISKKITAESVDEIVIRPQTELDEFIRERLNKKALPAHQRDEVIAKYHERLGHRGGELMFKQLWSDGLYWPGMRQQCVQEAASCLACLRWNVGKAGYHPMKGIISETPFQHISIDLADYTHCRSECGHSYVLVIIDLFTKFVILKPLKEKTAIEVASCLYEVGNLVGHYRILQSDNGAEFHNSVQREYNRLMNSHHRFISAYNPSANGVAENAVGKFKLALNKIMGGQVTNWDKFLSSVQYAMNVSVTALHGTSPFSLLYGRKPDPIYDVDEGKALVNCVTAKRMTYQLRKYMYNSI